MSGSMAIVSSRVGRMPGNTGVPHERKKAAQAHMPTTR